MCLLLNQMINLTLPCAVLYINLLKPTGYVMHQQV